MEHSTIPKAGTSTLSERPWYRWYALAVLTAVYASSHIDRQIMAMLLEPIKAELGATDAQMGFLLGLTFALFYATLGMPIAMLADRTNRRNIITVAASLWSLMTVLCGYAATFTQLALARVGVGVGEAGSTPPSHSMIADLFPAASRGAAMGIFALGINVGLLIAYLGGGWLSENYGWRITFIAVGAPGLLLAALLYLTVREPRRGASDIHKPLTDDLAPSFSEVAAHMWQIRSLRHAAIGAALGAFVGYGFVLWMPTFLVRSHGLSLTEVGMVLALMNGILGGLGSFTAGLLTDSLARRDMRWRTWVVALGKSGYVPFLVGMFLVDDLWLALALYTIPAFFGGFYLAPTAALVQSLVKPRMRALASSIVLFFLNIIGMGLGPQIVGLMSDAFAGAYGQESLRMALLVLSVINLWCAYHYLRAARTLNDDLEHFSRTHTPHAVA